MLIVIFEQFFGRVTTIIGNLADAITAVLGHQLVTVTIGEQRQLMARPATILTPSNRT